MKIVVSSPFRTGNSWLVNLISRALDYTKADFGIVTPQSLDNMQDNTVVRTNFLLTPASLGTAHGIRLLRNIPDAVAAKLLYGVENYLGKTTSVSNVFKAFLLDVGNQPVEWRTPKNCVELAITDHLDLISQFVSENMVHYLADPAGLTVVTYEELCHDAGGWLEKYFAANSLTPVRNPYQVAIGQTPAVNGSTDIAVSNWCAANLSQETNRRINNRVIAIRERILATP